MPSSKEYQDRLETFLRRFEQLKESL